jgi:hypothetical protein
MLGQEEQAFSSPLAQHLGIMSHDKTPKRVECWVDLALSLLEFSGP